MFPLNLFARNNPRKLIENELAESNVLLLQAHTNAEHWQAQIEYHKKKITRLSAHWNKLQQEQSKEQSKEKKDD